MAIFLDSALEKDAEKAFAFGFVGGITTNPKLLSQAKGTAESVIKALCAISPGPVFYQPTATTAKGMKEEAVRFQHLCARKVVIKVPCTTENLSVMAILSYHQGINCAATAVYSEGQAYLACEAGAKYLIPYVNRITTAGGNGPAFVTRIGEIARAAGKGTEILAASLKTPDEVAVTVRAGAHHVTLPLAVIEALGNDPRSDEAIGMFAGFVGK
jgi:transaldolase